MTLRLADAILLGSTMMKCGRPTASYERRDGKVTGCALEMALVAIGRNDTHWGQAHQYWPWLSCKAFPVGDVHVGCEFDKKVLTRQLTLSQFCAWVDSIDPTPRIEPPVQEPSQVEVRQESTVSHD